MILYALLRWLNYAGMSPCPYFKVAQFVRNETLFTPLIRNKNSIFEWLTFTGIVAHFAPEYAFGFMLFSLVL